MEKMKKINFWYVISPIAVIFFLLAANYFQIMNDIYRTSFAMFTILVLTFCYSIYKTIKKEMTPDLAVKLIIFAGLVMRIGYTIYTSVYTRAHDAGDFNLDSAGHFNYIYYIYSLHSLPDSNFHQFYHPPLFHALCALVLGIHEKIFHVTDFDSMKEMTKIVPCIASCISLLFMQNILDELNVNKKYQVLPMALLAFLPNYYLATGRLNNDGLAFMFMVMAIYYALKWYNNRTLKSLIGVAIAIGLGMSTKLSVVTIVFPIGALMIYVLIKSFKEKHFKETFIQYVIFMAVCAPLGLWYPIRNLVKFNQPLNYVQQLDGWTANELYCGNIPFFDRFIKPPFTFLKASPYNNAFEDYNISAYLIRGSLFGEFQFFNMDIIANLMVSFTLIILVITFAAAIYVMIKGKQLSFVQRFGMAIIFLISMGMYYSFNYSYPFGCTMDFRYLLQIPLCGAYYIGMGLCLLNNSYIPNKIDVSITTKEPENTVKTNNIDKKNNNKNSKTDNDNNQESSNKKTTNYNYATIMTIAISIIISVYSFLSILFFIIHR